MKRLLNLDLLEFHVREATQEADAQFDRNEKFPRPRDSVGWFAKFWPETLIRKSKRKRVWRRRKWRDHSVQT